MFPAQLMGTLVMGGGPPRCHVLGYWQEEVSCLLSLIEVYSREVRLGF